MKNSDYKYIAKDKERTAVSDKDRKKYAKEFEYTIEMAELKALSNLSLEQPLTQKQYNRMMELKKKIFK